MKFHIEDGVLKEYNREKGDSQHLVIPDGVTRIEADLAYYDFSSITIPESVTSIDSDAFGDEYYKPMRYSLYEMTMPLNKDCWAYGFNSYKNLNYLTLTINGHKIEIEASCRLLSSAFYMLAYKDFSYNLKSEIKYPALLDYFFITDDEDAKEYIGKNFDKIMKYLLFSENYEDSYRIEKLIEKTDFITDKNINKLLKWSASSDDHETFTSLTDYKDKNGVFLDKKREDCYPEEKQKYCRLCF